jgi:hypothetical protein
MPAFFALTRVHAGLFVVGAWSHHGGTSQEIRPGGHVPDVTCQVIADGMPSRATVPCSAG